jgi:hypothetical protein
VGGGSRKTAVALVIARLASLWFEDDAARTQVRYAITSLDPGRAGPARLGGLVRGQWEIENRLHWVREVVFEEDRSQVRTGH